jgi:glycosyltransferase involved in cell wall biosynthesis
MSAQKPHIMLLCSRLDLPGGTERASVNLANLFLSNGHEVTLLVLDSHQGSFYAISEGITIERLPLHFGIDIPGNPVSRKGALLRDIGRLRNRIRHSGASIVIGSEYHLTLAGWLAARGLGVAVIGWENHHIHWLKKNRFWTFLFRTIYPRLSKVVCQNSREEALFREHGCKATVIPYSLPEPPQTPASLQQKTLLTVGWLIHRKGVDLIPEIASRLAPRYPDWKWRIIGKGPEEERLRREVAEKNLGRFIEILPPVTEKIEDHYREAAVLVMTSRFECLPLVLLEGSSLGLPLVAFDCPTGPADIIQHGENGLLVPLEDTAAMAAAISGLVEDEAKRQAMGATSRKSSERYHSGAIYAKWEALFNSLH